MQHQQQHQKQMPLDKTNLEALELVLELKREQNIPITEIADQDGNSLMHKSIIYNQYEVTRYLIVNYPSLLGLKNCFGFYPIHLCVVKGSMQMLRLVCRESKKYINKRDNSGLTPAMLAAIEGKYEILKYLLDNANAKYTKITKKEKYSLLHLAVQSGSLDSVQYLLYKMGNSYLKFRSKDGATVHHLAAARGHDHILEYLLANKNSKLIQRLKDITGSTPAHDAAENGHYKCLKMLYDAGLDMFEQDSEHITPYDLAMASKNPDCRNFAINLKPTLSFDDGPIQINSSSLQNFNDLSNSNNITVNNNHISVDNTIKNNIAGGNKKIKLRKISSMLRLRRAKDINQNEPAYLYTQRFRPAPVSLPQSSQITGFKNGAPAILHGNEDDLNDSAIDEIINQVNNSGLKRIAPVISDENKVPIKLTLKKKEIKVASPSLNAAINKRISRYQQHCQQELDIQNDLKETEKVTQKSASKSKSPSTNPKKKSESHLIGSTKLKSSISSSHDESTPTLIKLSKSESASLLPVTLDNQTILSTNRSDKVQLNKNDSDNLSISSRHSNKNEQTNEKPKDSKQSPSLNSNFRLSVRIHKDDKTSQRKTVAFEEDPPVVIDSISKSTTLDQLSVKESGLALKEEKDKLSSKNSTETIRLKRTSITKIIGNSPVLASKPVVSLNPTNLSNKDDLAYDKLNHDTDHVYEPEPDYWDVPYEEKASTSATTSNSIGKSNKIPDENLTIKEKLAKMNSNSKTSVSLAEIIVKSISTASAKSSISSSLSSSVSNDFKQQLSNTNKESDEEELEKAIMPVNDHEIKEKNLPNSLMVSSDFNHIKNGFLTQSSLNRRYLEAFKSANDTLVIKPQAPIIPAVDYEDDEENERLKNKNEKLETSYFSPLEPAAVVVKLNVSSTYEPMPSTASTPPPPPPPPPANLLSGSSPDHTAIISRTLVTSISTESLLQAKQKLKAQSLNQSLPESNEMTMRSSPSPSSSVSISSNDNKSPDENTSSSAIKLNEVTQPASKKNDFFLKEIQNHRLYNTKKDYVLDFLDRNSSSSGSNHSNTYTPNHAINQTSNNIESIENNNKNNSSINNCIIEVNNTNFNNKQINRTLSSYNINSVLSNESTSLLDESSNTYSLSKSESFHSNHSDPIQKSFKKDETKQDQPNSVVVPKNVSNYERFPYIRNRQITPQPNTKYLSNNYTNYYNVSKRTKSNGPDTNRISLANQNQQSNIKNASAFSKPVENSLVKSISVDHINQLEHTTSIESQEKKTNKVSSLLSNYESPNKMRSAHNRSLTSLASVPNQEKQNSIQVESTENENLHTKSNTLKELPINGSMSNLVKKFRQLQPPEKEESELDRVFKKRALIYSS